jgi:hypothetical protein
VAFGIHEIDYYLFAADEIVVKPHFFVLVCAEKGVCETPYPRRCEVRLKTGLASQTAKQLSSLH